MRSFIERLLNWNRSSQPQSTAPPAQALDQGNTKLCVRFALGAALYDGYRLQRFCDREMIFDQRILVKKLTGLHPGEENVAKNPKDFIGKRLKEITETRLNQLYNISIYNIEEQSKEYIKNYASRDWVQRKSLILGHQVGYNDVENLYHCGCVSKIIYLEMTNQQR